MSMLGAALLSGIISKEYADQFGGPTGKKLQYKNFKKILLDHCSESVEKQKDGLERALMTWQGSYRQVDDILVIGVRV